MNKNIILILLSVFMLNSCLTATAGVGATGLSSNAKRGSIKETISDVKINTVIKAKFIDKGFNDLYKKISVNVLSGRVLLLGYVDSESDIRKAIHIVWDTEGVVDVINELKVSKDSNYFDTKQYITDSYLTTAVKTKLFGTKDVRSFKFTVITQDNIVYLFGTVDSRHELQEALAAASSVKGVDKVKAYIVVK